MASFSPSGVQDLPATSAESLEHGDPRVLGWLKEWIQEGDLINRSDPSYEAIDRSQQYIVGEQLTAEHRKLRYLPQVVVNESRKAIQAHVSALTDLQPAAGWRALNPAYHQQADLLNQYAIAEYVTCGFDLDLGDTIKYALAGGTGDLVVDWDPHAPLGGAHQLSARDPRDTLPLRPSQARSPQLWEGVCFRELHTINVLRGMYPTRAYLFKATTDVGVGRVMGRFRTALSRLISPASPLDLIEGGAAGATRRAQPGRIVLYRAYFRDRTRNLTDRALPMGPPGTNFAYVVPPGEPLYPRGRLIVATDDAIVYDGTNTYWHGLWPFARLRLWSVPWQFLGIPLFNDLLPVQDAINETVHDARLALRQHVHPDIIYNRNAVSESTMRLLDSRRPGKRIRVQPGFGDPYKKDEGPSAQAIQQCLELWDRLTTKFTDLSGTANLAALLQLRQLPSADTIQKYYEALTPEIRSEARQVEIFLRDVSEMLKVNYFQFLSTTKRVQILGPAGETLSDFDFDPGDMVPALSPADAGYTPELDASLTTRDERAQFFHKQFVFVVAPNSVLAVNAQEKKMLHLQLARMGYLDIVTLAETLGIPNFGTYPAVPLPPISPPPPQVAMALIAQGLQAAVAGGPFPQYTDPETQRTFLLDPSGQLLELRVPITVIERLQAQALLGLGMTANPAGRKASGQAPPSMETKGDEPGGRTTVTESEK
jgi:hypothetical protein